MSDQVIILFGTPVYIPEKKYVPTVDEYNYIINLDKRPNEGKNLISKNSYVLNEDPLKNLKNYFQNNLNNYIYKLLMIDEQTIFYITKYWCHYNYKETHH